MSQSVAPRVFVSAVSSDLRSARKLINDALTQIECLPIEESIFGTEYGPIRELLARKIESCQAVIHLVGRAYGGEPDPQSLPASQLRRSWTQIEYDIARELKKKLYIVVCDSDFPFDDVPGAESGQKAALQAAHREVLLADKELWHTVHDFEDLRHHVERLKVPLDEVRTELKSVDDKVTATSRKIQLGLLAIAALLLLLVFISSDMSCQQKDLRAGIDELQTELETLTRGMDLLVIDDPNELGLESENRPEVSELSKLSNKMEALVKQLTTQIGDDSVTKDDELRLRRAAAVTQYSRGLALLKSGESDDALLELDRAIESYNTLVRQDSRKELEDILARSLHDRGVVRFQSAVTRAEGAKDLQEADEIFKRLVEHEGHHGLKNELDRNQAALRKADAIEGGEPPTKAISPVKIASDQSPHAPQPEIVAETSGLSSIIVSQLRGPAALIEVHVLKAGASPTSSDVVQSTKKPGNPMPVEPGKYDIYGIFDDSDFVLLAQNLELKKGQRIRVDSDKFISRLVLSPLTLPGFPALKDAFVVKSGTDRDHIVYRMHTSKNFGSPMILEPGMFDILCTPVDGRFFTLMRKVEFKPGQTLSIDTNQHAAAVVCPDPKADGLEVKELDLVAAGTELRGSYYALQSARGFGQAMMVFAGESYDLVLHPQDGQPIKYAKNIFAKKGQITIVGNGGN